MIFPLRFFLAIMTIALLLISFQLFCTYVNSQDSRQQIIDARRSKFSIKSQSEVIMVPEIVASINQQENEHTTKSVKEEVKVESKPHPHTNLHPKYLQLINITNFNITINVDICNVTDIGIVTTVHTVCQNKAARDVIRQTWGTPNIPNVNTRLVFLLGLTDNQTLQQELLQESLDFGDMVQGGFVDSAHNLSYKSLFGNLWVSQFCEQAEFVVKTLDDMYVDLYAVYKVTRPYLTHQYYINNSFILCPVLSGVPILRDPKSKWYVSYEDLPRDTAAYPGNAIEYYPTGCSEDIHIINPGTASRLAEIGTSPKTRKFSWIGDVWVTGYLARDLNIKHLDMMEFWTMDIQRLLVMKSAQNPDIYHRDYISAPHGRNYKISLALHKQAQWCYLHNCWSNIYQPDRTLTEDDKINDEIMVGMFLTEAVFH